MTPQQQEIEKNKSDIKEQIIKVFEHNLTIFDWDIPENDDKKSAHLIFEVMQESMNELKKKIAEGKYNFY